MLFSWILKLYIFKLLEALLLPLLFYTVNIPIDLPTCLLFCLLLFFLSFLFPLGFIFLLPEKKITLISFCVWVYQYYILCFLVWKCPFLLLFFKDHFSGYRILVSQFLSFSLSTFFPGFPSLLWSQLPVLLLFLWGYCDFLKKNTLVPGCSSHFVIVFLSFHSYVPTCVSFTFYVFVSLFLIFILIGVYSAFGICGLISLTSFENSVGISRHCFYLILSPPYVTPITHVRFFTITHV